MFITKMFKKAGDQKSIRIISPLRIPLGEKTIKSGIIDTFLTYQIKIRGFITKKIKKAGAFYFTPIPRRVY